MQKLFPLGRDLLLRGGETMLVFGRFNKCATNKSNLYSLMTKHYKFCRWETEDKINVFYVWAEPTLSDDSTLKEVANKFEEYGALWQLFVT